MTPEFLTTVDLRVLDDCSARPLVMLLNAVHYASGVTQGVIIVPAGFCCDMASIPSGPVGGLAATLGITPTTGMRAAVVHDWLVQQPDFDRRTADRVFHEALTAGCGVEQAAADAMYVAVAAYTHFVTNTASDEPPIGA